MLLALSLVLSMAGCTNNDPHGGEQEQPIILVVNGETISAAEVSIIQLPYLHAVLPFTVVLESLGYALKWTDDTTAEVSINGKSYLLSLTEACLFKTETGPFTGSRGYAVPPPGDDGDPRDYRLYIEPEKHELFTTEDCLRAVLYLVGVYTEIVVDVGNMCVTITTVPQESTSIRSGIIYKP